MSILSDRRSFREIGGVRAYVKQVGWSLWWRTQPGSSKPQREGRGHLDLAAQRRNGVVPSQLPAARVRID